MANNKDVYYFSHDANARNDQKILMLRAEQGWQGYGLYWALVEMMFENEETSLCHRKAKGIAANCNIDITELESILQTCIEEGLFESDGETFWSNSLRHRKAKYHEMKKQKSEAGKKGMESRYKQNDDSVITEVNSVITETNKGKETKGKEIKLNEIKRKEIDTDIECVVEYYNLHRGNMPQAIKTTEQRKSAINKRIREYSLEEVYTVIDKAQASKFLQGENGNTWQANLDWLMKSSQFVKVLEGNYDNRDDKRIPNGFKLLAEWEGQK